MGEWTGANGGGLQPHGDAVLKIGRQFHYWGEPKQGCGLHDVFDGATEAGEEMVIIGIDDGCTAREIRNDGQ